MHYDEKRGYQNCPAKLTCITNIRLGDKFDLHDLGRTPWPYPQLLLCVPIDSGKLHYTNLGLPYTMRYSQ